MRMKSNAADQTLAKTAYLATACIAAFAAFVVSPPVFGPLSIFLGVMARVEGERTAWVPILLGIVAMLGWLVRWSLSL